MASLLPLSLRWQGSNVDLKELGPEGIENLAHWERQIRNRSEVRAIQYQVYRRCVVYWYSV